MITEKNAAMNLNTAVSTIMTTDVMILNAGDSLPEAVTLFNNHGIRHAPVLQRGELAGMLSWVDVKRLPTPVIYQAPGEGLEMESAPIISVREAMTPDPVSVQVGDSIREAAQILIENDFHALPVLDGERVVGIVSTTDVIRYFLENN